MRYLISIIAVTLLIVSCTPEEQGPLTDYPNTHLLLSADELSSILDDPDLFLVDARAELNDSLIAGATHFAAIRELTDSDNPIPNYLIGPDQFQEKMRNLGLNRDHRVVIYDGGNHLAAARLFYALDYYGFSNASLLNGGLGSWVEAGLPVTSEVATHAPGTFQFEVQEGLMCDFEYVTAAANDPDKIIFDARSTEEFSGERIVAERGGHIPNAVNLEWSSVLETEGVSRFLPAEEIRLMFAELGITPDKEVIPHCHTNVRGSHAYFTLRLMGYDSVRPYEGSWSEYGDRSDAIIQ